MSLGINSEADIWTKSILVSLRLCKKYRPKPKPEKKNHWGSRLLAGIKIKGKPKKSSPGQMRLPWDNQKVTESTEVEEVAKIFIEANCYNLSFGAR